MSSKPYKMAKKLKKEEEIKDITFPDYNKYFKPRQALWDDKEEYQRLIKAVFSKK